MPYIDTQLNALLFVAEIIGVLAFAVAGAVKAMEREMDVFGVLVLAVITALGGGIIRDLLVNRFPVSLAQPIYVYLAIGGGLLAILAGRVFTRYPTQLRIFDALGLAVFSILGAQVGIEKHLNLTSILLLGLLTGIGGGVVRDLLANEVPLVLRQEVYAFASLLGITALIVMQWLPVPSSAAVITGVLVTFLMRLAAIRWNLNLPRIRHRD